MTDGFQALVAISSSRPIAVTAGAKILYAVPGITTLLTGEDLNGSTVRPLHSDSSVEVKLGEVPADLTVVASSPQIPTSGQLAWSYSIAHPDLPNSYRVSGSLASAERTAQRLIFFAGVLLGVCGAAVLWLLESLVQLLFSRSTLSPHTGNPRAVTSIWPVEDHRL